MKMYNYTTKENNDLIFDVEKIKNEFKRQLINVDNSNVKLIDCGDDEIKIIFDNIINYSVFVSPYKIEIMNSKEIRLLKVVTINDDLKSINFNCLVDAITWEYNYIISDMENIEFYL